MNQEKKVIHEVKLDKSIIKLLWAFAVVLLLNALPRGALRPKVLLSWIATQLLQSS